MGFYPWWDLRVPLGYGRILVVTLVLKMLLESIHGFLHQPSALDAQLVILVHKFLDDDAGPLQQGSGLLLLLRTSDDLCPQQVVLGGLLLLLLRTSDDLRPQQVVLGLELCIALI